MRTTHRNRIPTRMVELPAKVAAAELPPEILAVVSLVAEILLDQQRKQVGRLRGELANATLVRAQRAHASAPCGCSETDRLLAPTIRQQLEAA